MFSTKKQNQISVPVIRELWLLIMLQIALWKVSEPIPDALWENTATKMSIPSAPV